MLSGPPSRRQLVLIASMILAVTVLVVVGAYGLVVGSGRPEPAPASSSSSASADTGTDPPPAPGRASPPTTTAPPGEDLPVLPRTTDPVAYARAVTEALLTWDTMSGLTPEDHARLVLADADPAGLETPALAADVANYLPTVEVWQQLRGYAVRQSVTIEAAFVPDSWDDIAASPAAAQLREGTVAVTIEATRHRAGRWLGEPADADHPVTFTVFVACPPAFDRCHTLRLSQLDTPLP